MFTISGLTDLEVAAILNALDLWNSTAGGTAAEKVKEQTGLS